jgi:hypothetical protein
MLTIEDVRAEIKALMQQQHNARSVIERTEGAIQLAMHLEQKILERQKEAQAAEPAPRPAEEQPAAA